MESELHAKVRMFTTVAAVTVDLYSHTMEPTSGAASDTVASAMLGTRR